MIGSIGFCWISPALPWQACGFLIPKPDPGPMGDRYSFVDIPWKTLQEKGGFPSLYFAIFAHAK